MPKRIVLDSTPLGLVLQKAGYQQADDCRAWLDRKASAGHAIFVPEIVDYEVRRELLRISATAGLARLDAFYASPPVRPLYLSTSAIRLAAELWARSRRQGTPTTDPHALDIDVILSAQTLAEGWPLTDFVVATSNVGHLAQFVPAEVWSTI